MYILARSDNPASERASFRNSETQVPQFGEMNKRNSPLLSSKNLVEVILPSRVVRDISGIVSTAFGSEILSPAQADKLIKDMRIRLAIITFM